MQIRRVLWLELIIDFIARVVREREREIDDCHNRRTRLCSQVVPVRYTRLNAFRVLPIIIYYSVVITRLVLILDLDGCVRDILEATLLSFSFDSVSNDARASDSRDNENNRQVSTGVQSGRQSGSQAGSHSGRVGGREGGNRHGATGEHRDTRLHIITSVNNSLYIQAVCLLLSIESYDFRALL